MDALDRIERTVEIDAPASRVWKLISEPGWYINDERIVEHRIERRGELDVVHDPVHGEFAFATVHLDEPRYAASAGSPTPPSPTVRRRSWSSRSRRWRRGG